MKKINLLDHLTSLFINIFAVLSAILICMTRIPVNSKVSFCIAILVGGAMINGVLMYIMQKLHQQSGQDTHQKQLNTLSKQTADLINTKDKEIAELKKKAASLPVIHSANRNLDNATLLQKCSLLEEFRGSFPYVVAEGYILLNIMKTEVVISSYSRWQIVGEFGGQLWSLEILRPDTQSYKEMLQLAASTKSPQEIQTFSMHGDMLWM